MNDESMMRILRNMYMQRLVDQEAESYFITKFEKDDNLHQLEHDPNIKTTITDKDMLLLHIDIALDKRDEVGFKALVKELEGVK